MMKNKYFILKIYNFLNIWYDSNGDTIVRLQLTAREKRLGCCYVIHHQAAVSLTCILIDHHINLTINIRIQHVTHYLPTELRMF